jgi:tetratricopeptide (TPR) repeat protein
MSKFALLIGVEKCGAGIDPLPAAPRDVEALAEVLLNPDLGGFDDVKRLLNPGKMQMEQEIDDWFHSRNPEDLALFFFSGHGFKDERRDLYFASGEAKIIGGRLKPYTATTARFVHDRILDCRAKQKIIILDCCFSGAFGNIVPRSDDPVDLKSQLGSEGTVVLASTTATQYSFEEGGKGDDLSFYTRYLVEGIKGGAADENGDGIISVEELHEYAARKVKENCPNMSPEIISLKKGKGWRIPLTQAPQNSLRFQYQREFEHKVKERAGELSDLDRSRLDALRLKLNLSREEAQAIEAKGLEPYQDYERMLQNYQRALQEARNNEGILKPPTVIELMDVRERLKAISILSAEQAKERVLLIECSVLDGTDLESYAAELERKRSDYYNGGNYHLQRGNYDQAIADFRQAEKYCHPNARSMVAKTKADKKIHQYKQVLTEKIQAQYPLSQQSLNQLKALQNQLELENSEIDSVQKPMLARAEEARLKQEAEENARKRSDFYNSAVSQLGRKNYSQAIADFEQSLQYGPSDAEQIITEAKRKQRKKAKRITINLWVSLSFFVLTYMPIGVLLMFGSVLEISDIVNGAPAWGTATNNSHSLSGENGIAAWIIVVGLAWLGAFIFLNVYEVALCMAPMPGAIAMAMSWAWAVAGMEAWSWTCSGALIGGLLVGIPLIIFIIGCARSDLNGWVLIVCAAASIGALIGALIGSVSQSYFASTVIAGGFGFALLGIAQWLLLLISFSWLGISADLWGNCFPLEEDVTRYGVWRRMADLCCLLVTWIPDFAFQGTFILGMISTLGLALGGGLGWWLKLSGFNLPI